MVSVGGGVGLLDELRQRARLLAQRQQLQLLAPQFVLQLSLLDPRVNVPTTTIIPCFIINLISARKSTFSKFRSSGLYVNFCCKVQNPVSKDTF